jgi:serine/threonine protein phosphatase PrpC
MEPELAPSDMAVETKVVETSTSEMAASAEASEAKEPESAPGDGAAEPDGQIKDSLSGVKAPSSAESVEDSAGQLTASPSAETSSPLGTPLASAPVVENSPIAAAPEQSEGGEAVGSTAGSSAGAPAGATAGAASDKTSPVQSVQNKSDLQTVAEGPAVHFLIKTSPESENDQKTFTQIRYLLDKAEPIMGETGKRFFYPFDLNFDKSFSVVKAEGNRELTETLGLATTLEDGQIVLRGCPPTGFDGQLQFRFARVDHAEKVGTHKKPMYIAHDPKTLWLDLPVEDFDGYPSPNEAWEARNLTRTDKMALAASCRGRSHAHAAKPRDDNFLIDVDEATGWNFVAAADGAGSAVYSRQGSMLACAAALKELRDRLSSDGLIDYFQKNEEILKAWKRASDARLFEPTAQGQSVDPPEIENIRRTLDTLVYAAVYKGYMAIHEEAAARKANIRDYHTTLLFAAFKKFDFGWFVISYWVGDGGMVVYDWNRQDRVLVLGAPDGGEFAGQTRFLTMAQEEINQEAAARRARYTFADDFGALILVTDGVTDPFFPSEKRVLDEAEWRKFWTETLPTGDEDAPPCPELFDGSPPEVQAAALRRWLDFWSKGNHDDRTILIVK